MEKFIRELHRLATYVNKMNQVESSRLDYQSIYKLRGKVDNIYDCPTAELLKKDIISDLSRIIGLVPGKRGNIDDIIPDKIFVLTDADQLVCL